MNLVLFTHPEFLGSQSHKRLASMLRDAYLARGHHVELRQPRARLRAWLPRSPLAKWAGYFDQYVLFPIETWWTARVDPKDTLYVFCDQALGPWIPVVARRPVVVHCLDLTALRSALGDIHADETSASGRIYQRFIRWGFRHATHFISISKKSKEDLHHFGGVAPLTSEVVYLGLNFPYRPMRSDEARHVLETAGLTLPQGSFVLHVGGGQWYKNTLGVVQIYAKHVARRLKSRCVPEELWMVSPPPSADVKSLLESMPPEGRVRFLQNVSNEALNALYSMAGALLFPSLAEGFGWPIVEGLASGCPVITTDAAPMSEVGGSAVIYLPILESAARLDAWAAAGAETLASVLDRSGLEKAVALEAGLERSRQFDMDRAIDRYLTIYSTVLRLSLPSAG